MELFTNAKAVRLRSHHNSKYLHADADEESVTQKRSDSSETTEWTVELVDNVPENNIIRLKSCFGKYLTASNQRFLLGMTGHKVLQTRPTRLDSSIEWEPVREGNQVQLKTPYGQFLRANGGPPPWRNSVTHDIPYGSSTKSWILWDVDVIDIVLHSPAGEPLPQSDTFTSSESNSPSTHTLAGEHLPQSDTFSSSESNSPSIHTPAGEPLPQSDTFSSSKLNSPSTHTTPEAFQVSRQQSLASKQFPCQLWRRLANEFVNRNKRSDSCAILRDP